jgi:RNA-binding protein Musashi
VKLAQPRYQRDSYPNEDGTSQGGGDFQQGNRFGTGGAVGAQQANFNAGPAGIPGAANTFDPQALAALYTRMFQITNAGSMNPAMMGGMNPMMGGFGGGMRPGMGMGMGMGAGMGMGGGMGGAAGMGRGGPQGMMGASAGGPGMNPNIPRGPRGAGGGPQGPGGAMGGQNVGPQRTGQRGQHNFHPYAR